MVVKLKNHLVLLTSNMYCDDFLMHQNHMSLLLLIHNVIHPNDLNILLLMDVVLNNVTIKVSPARFS